MIPSKYISMKYFILITAFICFSMNIFAQKQSFDVISYAAPANWQKTQNESGIQLSVTDKKTGAYAIAVITKATTADAPANENFNNDWARLVKSTVQVNAEPAMQDPAQENGWDIISGGANYADGSNKGMVTLLTATGGGKTVSVVLMTNTQQYQNELLSFTNSLELEKVTNSKQDNTVPQTAQGTNAASSQLTGIWGQYSSESYAGAGGSNNLTAGYDWREYYFSADGTYQFLQKNISYLYQNEIVFAYEKGTYKLNGNQLTISPQSGTVESWSKAGSDKAGKLLKTEKRRLENVTYTIDFHYFSGIKETNLVLQYNKQTVRDGAWSTNNSFKNSWLYKRPFNPDKPSIELPAGTKIPFKNKLFTASAETNINNNTPTAAINSPLTGKIWEAKSYEKFSAAYGSTSGAYTGGFWYYQYKFNANGSYTFVYSAASALATNPVNVLQYESGTYAVNGNQLTLSPQKGANEEWSVGKINNGMSAEHIREVLEKRVKRLKTTTRKLEKTTYPFTVEYWQGNNANALCLKHTKNTIREGSPGQNNQSCFFETAAAKAENYNVLFK